MNDDETDPYAGHLIWHIDKIHKLMTMKVDPMSEVDEMKAHLTTDDRNAIELMRERGINKIHSTFDFMEEGDDNDGGIDENEKRRLQHDKIALQEIHYVINQLNERRILMPKNWYKQQDEKAKNKKPSTPEEEKRNKKWVEEFIAQMKKDGERMDRELKAKGFVNPRDNL